MIDYLKKRPFVFKSDGDPNGGGGDNKEPITPPVETPPAPPAVGNEELAKLINEAIEAREKKALEDKDKTELQKALDAKAEAEKELETLKSQAEINSKKESAKAEAMALGASAEYAEVLANVCDLGGDIKTNIAKYKETHPLMFSKSVNIGDIGGGLNGDKKIGNYTPEQIAKLDMETYKKLREEGAIK